MTNWDPGGDTRHFKSLLALRVTEFLPSLLLYSFSLWLFHILQLPPQMLLCADGSRGHLDPSSLRMNLPKVPGGVQASRK